jgi:tetratricopeptide (TPR) repeat protein
MATVRALFFGMRRNLFIFGALALLGLAAGIASRMLREPIRPGVRLVCGELEVRGMRLPVEATLRCALSAEALSALVAEDPGAWPSAEDVLAELRRGLAEPEGGPETALAAAARRLERRLRAVSLERLIAGDRDSDFGFASAAERAGVPRAERPRPVLFVGVDAGDWQVIEPLLFSGQLPHLGELYREGAHAVLRGRRPLLSPLLWTTMATGVDPYEHGIKDFVAAGAPITSSMRRVPAFWNRLSTAGVDSTTVAWWATYPAEWVRGSLISDRVAYSLFAQARPEQGLTHPASLGPEAARLAASVQVPDELLARFVQLPPEALAEARSQESRGDLRSPVAHLIRTLRAMRTYHALALELLEQRPAPVLAVYYQAVDEVCHRFAAVRPPALPGAEAREASQGGAIDAVYRFQDELIGELWSRFRAKMGPEASILVVSDHGFFTGADRPADLDPFAPETASLWHRQDGIFLAAGPDIVPGEREPLEQTQVLPILLSAVGLAPPAELEGRVPEGLFRSPPPPPVPWPALALQRVPPPAPGEDEAARQAADAQRIEELQRLGYVGEAASNGPSVNAILVDAYHFERAGDKERALGVLRDALAASHSDEALALPAVQMALDLSRFDEASRILEQVPRSRTALKILPILQTAAWVGRGDPAEEIRRKLEAERADSPLGVALGLCDLALEHKDMAGAVAELREALVLEPGSPLLEARLEKLPEPVPPELLDAAGAAFRTGSGAAALGRWLGQRLVGAGQYDQAEQTFRRLLQDAPADRDLLERWATAVVLGGRPEAAIPELEAAGKAGAHTVGTRAVLATAYALQGRVDEAIQQYRSLLEIEPGRLEFYRPLVELLLQKGQRPEALRWVEDGLRRAAGKPQEAALQELRSRLQ